MIVVVVSVDVSEEEVVHGVAGVAGHFERKTAVACGHYQGRMAQIDTETSHSGCRRHQQRNCPLPYHRTHQCPSGKIHGWLKSEELKWDWTLIEVEVGGWSLGHPSPRTAFQTRVNC